MTEGEEENQTFKASCYCGKVKHEMVGKPVTCVICHCTNCQRHIGGPYVHTAAWLMDNVKCIHGSGDCDIVTHSTDTALDRQSCKTCGGRVADVIPEYNLVGFFLGTIEGAYEEGNANGGRRKYKDCFKPLCHLYYGSRVIDVVDGAPKMKAKKPEDGVLPET